MRRNLALAPVAAVALAVGAVTLASADSNGSSDDDHTRVIELFEHSDQQQTVDHPPTGPDLGDEFVFSSVLLTRAGGSQVGSDGGVCTLVREEQGGTRTTAHCVAAARLERGQITVQGLVTLTDAPTAPPFELAVTGGTGAYQGATGHLRVEGINETDSTLTLVLERGERHGGHD
jgi:hypothetical protein